MNNISLSFPRGKCGIRGTQYHTKKIVWVGAIWFVFSLACTVPSVLISGNQGLTQTPELSTDPTIFPFVTASMPFAFDYSNRSPLDHIQFPEKPIQIPEQWPSNYLLPSVFIPVDFQSGIDEVSEQRAWQTKYFFNGNIEETRLAVIEFLTQRGWDIEFNEGRGNSYVIIGRKGYAEAAIINIDNGANIGQVKILAIFFE